MPLLVSCKGDVKLETGTYFLSPHEIQGVLKTGNTELSLTVATLPDGSVKFIPDSMPEYSVVFEQEKSRVRLGDLEVEGDFSLSVFARVADMFSDMRKADFTAYLKDLNGGLYKISSNGTTLFFSRKTLLPERLEKNGTVFVFKDFT